MEEEKTISELDHFSNLNSKEDTIRINAANGLLKRLKLESTNNPQNAYYICKRLIRGLGGSNVTFRQGCFSCLVGFMKLLPPDFNISVLNEIIESELHPSGNQSKQEQGEAFLGQILAYGAMIVSKLLYYASIEDQEATFNKLFELGRKRSYLHHASYVFMREFIKNANQEFSPVGFVDDLRDLNDDPLDKLNYLLTLDTRPFKTSTIKKVLGTKKFLDMSNILKIMNYLKKSKTSVMLGHNFIDEFITALGDKPDLLLSCWSTLIVPKQSINGADNSNEVNKPSSNDDALILFLCSRILKICIVNGLVTMGEQFWSRNMLLLILRNLKKNKSDIQSLLSDFITLMKSASDEVKLNIIKQTMFDQGIFNLDQLTGTKSILTLTNSLLFEGLTDLASSYKDVIENKIEVGGFELKNKVILTCLNNYTKLINSPTCYDELPWRSSQLQYLLKLGFFKQPDVHLNREMTTHVQEAFLTSLGHRFPNLESFKKVINSLFFELNNLLKEHKGDLLIKFSDEMFDAWKKSYALSEEMSQYINEENKEVIDVLTIILQYMSLLILKEANTAITNIQDLGNIYLEIKEGRKFMWIEVLIDLFLNLLSKPNYNHRHLIRCTFKTLCPHLTEQSFSQIIEVLELSYDPQNMIETSKENESDGNESNSDSAESDDHSETDDEITINDKLRFELQNVLAAGSDVESVDLDDIDEDEGRRLNETLGTIFKSNMKRKKGNSFSKYQNQLAHFRTRVMDLIEICTEVALPLSYWLIAIIPLVELYESTIGQKPLDSLRSRINYSFKKLNTSKVIFEDSLVKETKTVLEELFGKLSKLTGIYCDMKKELSCIIRFILKSSKPLKKGVCHINNNEIFQLFKTQLDDFFLGKNNIPVSFFNSVISIGWEGVLPLIPNFFSRIFDDDVKFHKRIHGIKMIETFIKTPQFFDGHLEIYFEQFLTDNRGLLHDLLNNEINKLCLTNDINLKFWSELFSLLIAIFKKQMQKKFPEIISQTKVRDHLILKYHELPALKGPCKQNFNKLNNFLNINIIKNIKETEAQKSNVTEGTVKKIESKRKKKDKLYDGIKRKAKRLKPNKVEIVCE